MSKEIKIAGSISFGGKRLNVYGDLDAPLFKAKDILPLVKWNDVRLVLGEEDEICLLRKEFITETLSDKILEMTVIGIENDEAILDTVNIYVFGYKTED